MVFSRYFVALRSCAGNLTATIRNGNVNSKKFELSSRGLLPKGKNYVRENGISNNNDRNNNSCRYYSTSANENSINDEKRGIELLPSFKDGENETENKPLTDIISLSESVRNFKLDDIEKYDLEFLTEIKEKRPGALDVCTEHLSHIGATFPISYNFAAYANDSPMIQKLAELGVDFSRLEKRKGIAEILLPLDFEKDMKRHIQFLNDCGVPADELGKFLTKNPMIFKEDIDDLHTRIRYLRAHKFTADMVTRIITQNPYWIMFSTKRIDRRLGFFQTEFSLSGDEIRALATKQPRLVTYRIEHVKENTFSVREEMGFDKYETKMILLKRPRIFMKTRQKIVETFDYAHNEMKLSHAMISQEPGILTCRLHRLKQRHMFLVTQKRAQYDPKKPLYVSIKSLIGNADNVFCTDVAKAPVETFNAFLKTL